MIEIQSRRVALYARHSCELQDGSAADQLARCRRFVRDKGGAITVEYSDEAMSGAVMANRPGLRRLMAGAVDGLFDAVCIEDLSRVTRDQEDAAGILKRLVFLDIPIVSVTEGVISELHVGLKGTMNALYLKELADKTRRGQAAAVGRGKVPGGTFYGYDLARSLAANGQVIRGTRTINEAEAAVVRRIFSAVDAGRPLRAICRDLNSEAIPSPRGRKWAANVLAGSRPRGDGLLRRPIYKGELVFGRTRVVRDPETGKRIARVRPASERITTPAPELAIVTADLWERVQHRINGPYIPHSGQQPGRKAVPRKRKARSAVPTYVTSGLTRCARCGQRVTTAYAGWLSCRGHREHGSCDHRFLLRRDDIVRRTLRLVRIAAAIRPRTIAAALRDQHAARQAAAAETVRDIKAMERELAAVTRRTHTLLDLLTDGAGGAITRRKIAEMETEARSIASRIAEARHRTAMPAPDDALDRMTRRAAAILEAEATRLLAGREGGPEATETIRSVLARIDVEYRGPGRTRLRVVPHIDPAGLYDLALPATTRNTAVLRPPGMEGASHHAPPAAPVAAAPGPSNPKMEL